MIAFDYIKLKYLGQGAGIWVETCETLGQALTDYNSVYRVPVGQTAELACEVS